MNGLTTDKRLSTWNSEIVTLYSLRSDGQTLRSLDNDRCRFSSSPFVGVARLPLGGEGW